MTIEKAFLLKVCHGITPSYSLLIGDLLEVHEDASLLALEEDNGLVIGRSTYGPSKNRASSSSPVAVRQFITDADGKVTLNGRSNHDTTYESNHRIKRDNFDDVVAAENVQQNEDITVDAKDSI